LDLVAAFKSLSPKSFSNSFLGSPSIPLLFLFARCGRIQFFKILMCPKKFDHHKHRKAEELIAKGFPIRMLTESDFASMV
jgi:hypothetical protein